MKKCFACLLLICMGIMTGLSLHKEAKAASVTLCTAEGQPFLACDPATGSTANLLGRDPLPDAPNGLEALYAWMKQAGAQSDTWLWTMPNGRALISCSHTELGRTFSAQELKELWPAVASRLMKQTLFIYEADVCAGTVWLYGQEWVKFETFAVLDGKSTLPVTLEGYAFCEEGTMVELWLGYPAQPIYLYDDVAFAQWQADVEAGKAWLQSVRTISGDAQAERDMFADETILQLPAGRWVNFVAPDDSFSLSAPENCLILLPDQLALWRKNVLQNVAEGSRRDRALLWLNEAERYHDVLLLDPNLGAAMLISSMEGNALTKEELQAGIPALTKALGNVLEDVMTDEEIHEFAVNERMFWQVRFMGSCFGQPLQMELLLTCNTNDAFEINLWLQPEAVSTVWTDAFAAVVGTITNYDVGVK